jgi:polyisoprenoid-binding protein YceI
VRTPALKRAKEQSYMSWKIDGSHSKVGFAVRHMMITTVRGAFATPTLDLSFDPKDLSRSSVKVTIDAKSVDTNEPARDAHLKSADFFDVENHPSITFVSKSASRKGDDLEVVGDLTIRGTTRSVTLKGEVQGPAKDPWGGNRFAFSLSADIDREEFGLKWNQALEAGGVLVAKKVKLEVEFQLVEG